MNLIKLYQNANTVDRPIENVMREEIMETFKYLKIEKASGPTEVYAEMISASGNVGIRVLMEFCHRILDEKGMPKDWATSVAIPIFNGKKRYHELCHV